MRGTFSLINRTTHPVRGVAFKKIKEKVLGTSYELSVALITAPQARRVTKQTKNKDKASNVLAFPLSKRSGEILLCPATAKQQAAAYEMTPKIFLTYLFIHGCLHLKGMDHGGTMDRAERRLLASVSSFKNAKNSHRHRRRVVSR
jgi:probable rRNA maturation factor